MTIRRPTNLVPLLKWWRDALAGKAPPIYSTPELGYFKRRLVKGGPWVPARIWLYQKLDRDGDLIEEERIRCMVNGEERNPDDEWGYLASNPIPKAEFDFMCATVDWVENNAPDEPVAQPRKRIDFMKTPLPDFSRKGKSNVRNR